ncbi:MAG: thioredoxin family protein [Bacteroidia bacterium]|nr:thioredoxin family protein [Bacteroidia bacterium]
MPESAHYLTKGEYRSFFEKGLDYAQYRKESPLSTAAQTEEKMKEYIHLNDHRMNRLDTNYLPGEEVLSVLKTIPDTLYWLVISEHWCGDAAQNVPVLHKIAEASAGKIQMRIVYRDQNLTLMDAHLTNGSRSIPKLIQLNEAFEVVGVWGPRPAVAQELVIQLRSNPETRETYANELHKWYAFNRSQNIEKEIITILNATNT